MREQYFRGVVNIFKMRQIFKMIANLRVENIQMGPLFPTIM